MCPVREITASTLHISRRESVHQRMHARAHSLPPTHIHMTHNRCAPSQQHCLFVVLFRSTPLLPLALSEDKILLSFLPVYRKLSGCIKRRWAPPAARCVTPTATLRIRVTRRRCRRCSLHAGTPQLQQTRPSPSSQQQHLRPAPSPRRLSCLRLP